MAEEKSRKVEDTKGPPREKTYFELRAERWKAARKKETEETVKSEKGK